MDEKGIKLTWTPEGVAGIWLAANMPSSSREDQIALGNLLQTTWTSAVRQAIAGAIGEIGNCPTVSAAQAKMEAMIDELKHMENIKRREEAVDFDPTRP